MSRPRILDAFCGAGGASVGYSRAGFEVTGVDIRPQKNYPFAFHQGDAIEFIRERGREFSVIHASPPCQSYLNLGAVNRARGRVYDHPDLIAVTRRAVQGADRPYVLENVVGAPLRDPVQLCGTGFGLPLRRHRLFESSVLLFGHPCAHERFREPRYWTSYRPNGEHRLATTVQVYGNGGRIDEWGEAMGIDWMTKAELVEAIPPVYTKHLGRQLLAALTYQEAV